VVVGALVFVVVNPRKPKARVKSPRLCVGRVVAFSVVFYFSVHLFDV
jgi:hypothetical protein